MANNSKLCRIKKKNFENTKVKAELTFVIALGGGRLGDFLLLDRQVPPQPGGLL